jgi:hypothetical protein
MNVRYANISALLVPCSLPPQTIILIILWGEKYSFLCFICLLNNRSTDTLVDMKNDLGGSATLDERLRHFLK